MKGYVKPIPELDAGPYAGAVLVLPCSHVQHVWITQAGEASVYRWVMPEVAP